MLTIEVNRKPPTENGMLGNLRVLLDGVEVYKCYTLEDPIREKKVWGDTAIPAGTYNVVVSFSNRFKKDLPEVQSVPNYAGVRIHGGNDKEDTHGCILVGTQLQALGPSPRIGICAPAVERITSLVRAHKSATLKIKDA